jgi:hypothetical protein
MREWIDLLVRAVSILVRSDLANKNFLYRPAPLPNPRKIPQVDLRRNPSGTPIVKPRPKQQSSISVYNIVFGIVLLAVVAPFAAIAFVIIAGAGGIGVLFVLTVAAMFAGRYKP